MKRLIFVVAALLFVLNVGNLDRPVQAVEVPMSCADPEVKCSMPGEFCGDTHREICSFDSPCCTGWCLNPDTTGACNGDSAQCRCYDVPAQ